LEAEVENLKLQGLVAYYKGNLFTYSNLVKEQKMFAYLCGLEPGQFDILMDFVRPYSSLLPHSTERSFDFETQYLAVLTICRHALDYRFMAFILKTSVTTIQRIANGWIIFLATIFNRIDL